MQWEKRVASLGLQWMGDVGFAARRRMTLAAEIHIRRLVSEWVAFLDASIRGGD